MNLSSLTTAPPRRQVTLAPGSLGTRQTLQIMAALVKRGSLSPEIRAHAVHLVSGLRQKDYLAEAKRAHQWVRDEVRYTRDIAGVETLHTAQRILQDRAGDCDDKSILIGALLSAIGHRVRLVAVGFGPRGYSHVYPETQLAGRWFPLEATEPWGFGQGPNRPPTRRMIEEVKP